MAKWKKQREETKSLILQNIVSFIVFVLLLFVACLMRHCFRLIKLKKEIKIFRYHIHLCIYDESAFLNEQEFMSGLNFEVANTHRDEKKKRSAKIRFALLQKGSFCTERMRTEWERERSWRKVNHTLIRTASFILSFTKALVSLVELRIQCN